MSMDKALFDDLVKSLHEAGEITTGKVKASRRFVINTPDVKSAREKMGLTQFEFALLLRVSIKTLQNWEQHRRTPTGPASALLKIVSSAPELALKTLCG